MVRRSRSIPLPEPASLTNSLKICERCRLTLRHCQRRIGVSNFALSFETSGGFVGQVGVGLTADRTRARARILLLRPISPMGPMRLIVRGRVRFRSWADEARRLRLRPTDILDRARREMARPERKLLGRP
jgi:hypothetical protein